MKIYDNGADTIRRYRVNVVIPIDLRVILVMCHSVRCRAIRDTIKSARLLSGLTAVVAGYWGGRDDDGPCNRVMRAMLIGQPLAPAADDEMAS